MYIFNTKFKNQNSNIEEFINENYKYFEPTSLIDFLGDLNQERVEINQTTCTNFIRPIQVKTVPIFF